MASQYTVDSDAISAHGTDTATLVTEFQTSLANLNAKFATLQTQWKGSASTNFATLMQQWHTDATNIKETLSSISSTLHLTSNEYATAEQNNMRRWMAV